MRISKIEKLNKEIKELENAMDTEEFNMKMFIKNFTGYKIETVSQSEAWYIITKNNIEITLDEKTEKPMDIEECIWNKVIDYVGVLEIQYKRYIKLLDKQEESKQSE